MRCTRSSTPSTPASKAAVKPSVGPHHAAQLPHRHRRGGRVHVADAGQQRQQRVGSAELGQGGGGHAGPEGGRRAHEEVAVEQPAHEGHDAAGVGDELGVRERGQLRPRRHQLVDVPAVVEQLGQAVGAEHPVERGHHPLAGRLADVVRVGHVGRHVGVVAEERVVDELGRRARRPLAVGAGDRHVDVEVAAEHVTRLGRAPELAPLERAEADVAVGPALHHAGPPHERPPERAGRVGQHLARVGAAVDREAGARRAVDQPPVVHAPAT